MASKRVPAPSSLNRQDGKPVASGAKADSSGERIFLDDSWKISDRESDGGHVAIKREDEDE